MHRHCSSLLGLSLLFLLNSTSLLLANEPTSSPASQGGTGEETPRTAGTGSRNPGPGGYCSASTDDGNQLELTPIIPQGQIIYTKKERVNLYVYIPPISPESNALASLEILEAIDSKTEIQEVVFDVEFGLKTGDTIARLVLPESVQFLPESNYTWKLLVYCDPSSDATIYVEGQIHRLESGDAAVTPRLWHEDLEDWWAEHETNPEAWRQSLAAENLGEYAERTVETYSFENPDTSNSESTPE